MKTQTVELLFQTADHDQLEFEMTKNDIRKERRGYLEYSGRVERARGTDGQVLDVQLGTEFGYKESRMNHLLERLFDQMATLGIEVDEDVPPTAC
jgi:hypothetical protein